MARAYSVDLRKRILSIYDQGESPEKLAETMNVSASWIYKLLKKRKEEGHITPAKPTGGPKPKLAEHKERIRAYVHSNADATLYDILHALNLKVNASTLWRMLDRMGITLKKSHPRG